MMEEVEFDKHREFDRTSLLHDVSTYKKRVDRIQDVMRDKGFDFLILSSPENIFYVSGAKGYATLRPLFVLIQEQGSPLIITPKIEWEFVKEGTWIDKMDYYVEWGEEERYKDPVKLLSHYIEPSKEGFSLALEGDHLSNFIVESIRKAFPSAEIHKDGGAIPGKLRMVKDQEEIEIMREVGQVAIAEVEAEIEAIEPGKPEYEISLSALSAGVRKAAELMGSNDYFSPMIEGNQMVGFGTRSSVVHSRSTTRQIQKDELIIMCFCEYAQFSGYRLGMTRMAKTGEISNELEKVISVARSAQSRVLEEIRPGIKAGEMDLVAQEVIKDAGYGKYITHRTGRGVGIGYVEDPQLREGDDTRLKPGMTTTIEPGIYIPGVGGARFEDTVLITEDGYESLTPYSKDIKQI